MNILSRPMSQRIYEAPKIDIIQFSCLDIITTSGNGDENQGEWDTQTFDENQGEWDTQTFDDDLIF